MAGVGGGGAAAAASRTYNLWGILDRLANYGELLTNLQLMGNFLFLQLMGKKKPSSSSLLPSLMAAWMAAGDLD